MQILVGISIDWKFVGATSRRLGFQSFQLEFIGRAVRAASILFFCAECVIKSTFTASENRSPEFF
jgi:hypothetical protein